MSLTLRLFEVGHGDSILLEEKLGDQSRFVLIDCNSRMRDGALHCPPFEYLKLRGVSKIDALVITHLHADHYFGVHLILDSFSVGKIVVPPFISQNDRIFREVVEQYKRKLRDAVARSSSSTIGARALSLARLLAFICENEDLVQEGKGPESILRFAGISTFEARVLLPHKRIKGLLNEQLRTGKFDLDSYPGWNDASLAILLEVEGVRILLGGDSTLPQWNEHMRQMKRDGKSSWDVVVLKAPHHGSDHNNTAALINYLYGVNPEEPAAILVSANGRSHPGSKFYQLVKESGLTPYCTNLSTSCADQALEDLDNFPAEMRQFLMHYPVNRGSARCQGDVVVRVNNGRAELFNTTGHPCVYDDMASRAAWSGP